MGARKVLRQVCTALQTLHDLGLVHRDVKPENVMISQKGRVVLIDFNAARQVTPEKKDTEVLGTVGYAAPEQMGVSHTDARTDIYALGVLYNVMLTGQHPTQVIPKGRAGHVIRKCTAVNPEDRYQTADKLSAAL
jgi:serine/threonine protein kinase